MTSGGTGGRFVPVSTTARRSARSSQPNGADALSLNAPISLCLNLPNTRTAVASPFLNGTCHRVTERSVILKDGGEIGATTVVCTIGSTANPLLAASGLIMDKNRVKAGAYAIKKFGCDTLVLDDGFQYLPLKGRLNLLLVDKTNPFGNGHLLPRGVGLHAHIGDHHLVSSAPQFLSSVVH